MPMSRPKQVVICDIKQGWRRHTLPAFSFIQLKSIKRVVLHITVQLGSGGHAALAWSTRHTWPVSVRTDARMPPVKA